MRSGTGGPMARVETLNAYGYGLLRQRFPDERNRVISEPFWPGTNYLNELVNEYGHQVFSSMLSKIKNEVFDPRSTDRRKLASWITKNRVHLLRDLENEQIVSKVDDKQFGSDLATEYLAYEKFLTQRNGIDFDDQKLRPLIRLRNDSRLLGEIQGMLDEVIVDEFQDINKLDCELIDAISTQATLVVTGDDDQAIYGFRGASAEYLINPKAAFDREFTHYELSINYRCAPKIIDAAGKVITNNGTRIEKRPKAAKELPGTVEAISAKNVDVESLTIARRAGTLLHEPDGTPRTVAILTRTNSQALELQSSLIRAETPYSIAVENDLRVTWELARRMLALAPMLRKRGVPEAETRATVVECFARSRKLQANQVSSLRRMAIADEVNFPGPEMLQLLPDRMRSPFEGGLRTFKKAKDLSAQLGALEDFLNAVPSSVMNGGRKTNQASRLSGMIDLAESFGERRTEFLAEVERLISIQREALRRDTVPKVTLSTCHGAKGREWQVVFVPFCNDGIFPDARSDEGEYLEAERKLFYVSMTRASEHLIVSWADFRPDTGRKQAPSVFAIEAGLAKAPPAQKAAPKAPGPTANGQRSTSQSRQGAQRGTGGSAAASAAPWWNNKKTATTEESPKRPPRMITLFSVRSRVVADGMDPKKVGDLATRMLEDEERYDLPAAEMTIRYQAHDPEATLPLQLDLALRGVPFAILDAHRFTESDTFQSMREAWQSGKRRVAGSLGADTIGAMERILARTTGSHEHRRWQAALERIADEEPGTDPEGVKFTAS
jgi:DNA helicase-2/ATP-dependent DNA helicase PcrA